MSDLEAMTTPPASTLQQVGRLNDVMNEECQQSAYLVGISDPSSVTCRLGLLDQCQVARAYEAIRAAYDCFLNPTTNQQQVRAAVTDVLQHTLVFCSACLQVSSKTSDPVVQKTFVQSEKNVANNVANVVDNFKALKDDFYSEDNRQKCAASTKRLFEAVDEVVTFASSPEFTGIPAETTSQHTC
ncbi:talin-2-like [Anneissia japonica]|uniref:talin-2-like n=1 Tax=Anneissia japonica TaxID=1529436 RepID=UPI00142569E8|nr:talin-2-like [Anneissia japonica]